MFKNLNGILLPLIIGAILFNGCGTDDQEAREQLTDLPFLEFYDKLAAECGNAYSGTVKHEPDTEDNPAMFSEDQRMIVHFRECDDEQLKIPFHIHNESDDSWDRSRTWIITKHGDGLELRHDHRKPDGSDDDFTMYGGFTIDFGTENRQDFQSMERTEANNAYSGWRIEMKPGERYTYGTVNDTIWDRVVEFDLSEPIEPPPAPWGHE